MKAGFMIIPDVFLEHQHDLKLDATDINIVFHLARYWCLPTIYLTRQKRQLPSAWGSTQAQSGAELQRWRKLA